ncbi:YoaK family protein [Methylobacterium sp. A54F]
MTRSWQLTFGLLLTGLAGFVDALGFIRLGGLYTSFMSGNTTQLAVSLGHGRWDHAVMPWLLIAMFLVGSTLGSGLSMVTPARWATPVVLAYEALVIVAALSLGLATPELGLASLFMALAMGAQNAVLGSVQGFRAGTTFVTGALFSLGQKIAAALTGKGPRFGWVGDAAVWMALLGGAYLGAVAYGAFGLYALVLPAGLAGLLAITAALLVALGRAAATPA